MFHLAKPLTDHVLKKNYPIVTLVVRTTIYRAFPYQNLTNLH
jgi:hypothetical protein